MNPMRAMALWVLLVGLCGPAWAEEPPPPAPSPQGVQPPARYLPEEVAPPADPAARDPFPDEPEWPTPLDDPLEGFDANDPPSGGTPAGPLLALPTTPPTETAVVGIAKTHNVAWLCGCENVALQLDVLFAVVGHEGDYVGATADFFNADGRPLMSVHAPYLNRSGQVSVWTRLLQIQHDARYLRTAMVVPYKAFPCPPCNEDSYQVEARVRLIERVEYDTYRELAVGSTTFTVHSTRSGDGARDWRDYTGATRAPLPSCAERAQRWRTRPNALEESETSPGRAKEMWQPFCPVPGA